MHAFGLAVRNPTADGVTWDLSAGDLVSLDVTLSLVCLGDAACVFVQPGVTNRLARATADTKERAEIGGSRITISLPRREYCAILSGSEAPI